MSDVQVLEQQRPPVVLIVSNVYFPTIGGISTYIRDLSEELSTKGIKIQIVSFPTILNKPPRTVRWFFYMGFIGWVFCLALLHTLCSKRLVIHSHSASFCLLAAVITKMFLGCRAIHTFHSPLDHSSFILSKFVLRLDAVVYVSNATRGLYRKNRVPSHRNEHIIPGGINIAAYNKPDPLFRASFDPPRILFVGRICEEKGVLELVQAVARMQKDVVLEIVGNTQANVQQKYLKNIQNIIKSKPALSGRIAFIGKQLGSDLAASYSRATIFVCPSIWEEPAPMVIAEALASGIPVVAFDTGGLRERINDGIDGLFIPLNDIDKLAVVLDDLLEDRQRLDEMSMNARKRAEDEFDRSIMARNYLDIYNNS